MINRFKLLAAAALSSAALSAHAVPVQWLGFAAGSQNVTVGETNAGGNVSAAAGAFNVSIGGQTFLTYCVELTQYATSTVLNYTPMDGVSYFNTNYVPALLVDGATIVDRLGRLFTYLGGMNTPTAVGPNYSASEVSAAIQLAVWESVYEGNNVLSVSGAQNDLSNKFTAVSAPGDVVAYANSILAGAANVVSQYSISVVKYGSQPSDQYAQDYILIQRVPEPATLALTVAGLLGLGVVRRRRRS